MSSFHPLGADDQDPLTFRQPSPPRDDDDMWTPPVLPGDHMPGRYASSTSRQEGTSPLETPLDPLLNTLPTTSSDSIGAPGTDSGDFRQRGKWESSDTTSRSISRVESSAEDRHSEARNTPVEAGAVIPPAPTSSAHGSSPAGLRMQGTHAPQRTLAMVHSFRLHSYYAPTFCDACSQLLIGIMQQGVQCTVCSMNLHPECRVTSCSMEHYCRRPEPVHISAGVDESQLEALGLKPQNPSASKDGGEGIGAVLARSGNTAKSGAPLEEPLESEWHKTLMRAKQLWVPDSLAAGCMVCSRSFNLVIRRHHCRRCGACMCGWCSHTTVSDKILSINQNTGAVTRLHSPDPVRCCTPCTRILDQQLKTALQRKCWGAKQRLAGPETVASGQRGNSSHTMPSTASRPGPTYNAGTTFDSSPKPFGTANGVDGNSSSFAGAKDVGRKLLDNGAEDPIFRSRGVQSLGVKADASQSAYNNGTSRSPQYHKEEPSTGVPSWLGNSTLSSKRATSTTTSDTRVANRGSGKGVDTTAATFGVGEPESSRDPWATQQAKSAIGDGLEDDVFGSGGGVFDSNPLQEGTAGRSDSAAEPEEEDVLDWLNSGSVV